MDRRKEYCIKWTDITQAPVGLLLATIHLKSTIEDPLATESTKKEAIENLKSVKKYLKELADILKEIGVRDPLKEIFTLGLAAYYGPERLDRPWYREKKPWIEDPDIRTVCEFIYILSGINWRLYDYKFEEQGMLCLEFRGSNKNTISIKVSLPDHMILYRGRESSVKWPYRIVLEKMMEYMKELFPPSPMGSY